MNLKEKEKINELNIDKKEEIKNEENIFFGDQNEVLEDDNKAKEENNEDKQRNLYREEKKDNGNDLLSLALKLEKESIIKGYNLGEVNERFK